MIPTRKELVELCVRGLVPQKDWTDRDSSGAQIGLGRAWVLLQAGCEYQVEDWENHDCWFLTFDVEGFSYFEDGETLDYESAYIPKAERLDKAAGKDWY